MRIGIDVQPLQTGTRYGGVGCYLTNLLISFTKEDTENTYVCLLNNSNYLKDISVPVSSNWTRRRISRKHRLGKYWWLWDTIYLPMVIIQEHIDIYHYNSLAETENMAPPFSFGKHRVVATIYDVIPLKIPQQLPQYFSSSKFAFDYTAKMRRLQRADAIITISEHAKHDIMDILNIPEDRITVAYGGIARTFYRNVEQSELEQFNRTYHLPESFILYIGGYYSERKNIHRLLDAYALCLREMKASIPPLVLAGLSNPVHKNSIQRLVSEKQLEHIVCYLPYIPEEELPLLYRAATLFVYPSLYEGFGLPVAEALACGTVVATSNCSSLPEIGGDSCLYFDPYSLESIAEILYEGLTNTGIRKILQQKGPEQVSRFSWHQTARSVMSVYQQVYKS